MPAVARRIDSLVSLQVAATEDAVGEISNGRWGRSPGRQRQDDVAADSLRAGAVRSGSGEIMLDPHQLEHVAGDRGHRQRPLAGSRRRTRRHDHGRTGGRMRRRGVRRFGMESLNAASGRIFLTFRDSPSNACRRWWPPGLRNRRTASRVDIIILLPVCLVSKWGRAGAGRVEGLTTFRSGRHHSPFGEQDHRLPAIG